MRMCSRCGIEKQGSDYYANGSYVCKACTKERAKTWYLANTERAKANTAAYAKAHPEKLKEWQKKSYHKNHAKILAQGKLYRERYPERRRLAKERWRKANMGKYAAWASAYAKAHPEKRAIAIAAWAKRNAARLNANKAKRMADRKNATPEWANRFFIEEIYDLAKRRTEATGIKWSVDHIVPLQSPLVCGLHVEHNLRAIPHVANISKKNFWWPHEAGFDKELWF